MTEVTQPAAWSTAWVFVAGMVAGAITLSAGITVLVMIGGALGERRRREIDERDMRERQEFARVLGTWQAARDRQHQRVGLS